MLEYLALNAENELLRIENEKLKAIRCPHVTRRVRSARTRSLAGSMECPVCYESEARCRFTCGHGFCEGCTKSWYMKGKSSCPMCRASMCFKGITKLKKAVAS
jgi:hypothetical protein